MTMGIYGDHEKWRHSSKRYMKVDSRSEECKRVNMRFKLEERFIEVRRVLRRSKDGSKV
jgi:hypothetical protein